MDALSSLISDRNRAKWSDEEIRFGMLFEHIKIQDLEEPFSKLKIIHVAGTKGKGSTCTFVESILRNYGFHTGLFTSPHLIDIGERFRLAGVNISEKKFLAYFWWCWGRLKENTGNKIPLPHLFRFLCLLSFKIFIAEKVQAPTVCGISSLGYDHMEILERSSSFYCAQRDDAMRALEEKASQLDV